MKSIFCLSIQARFKLQKCNLLIADLLGVCFSHKGYFKQTVWSRARPRQGEFSQLTVTVCGRENETDRDRQKERKRKRGKLEQAPM